MDNFLGEIRLFAGPYAPEGWMLCNGQLLTISGYEALFSLIGITYGGDGRTTFAVPNLQCRLPIGAGQGPGLSNYVLGQSGGTPAVTLTADQMPSHTHGFNATTADATTMQPGGAVFATASGDYGTYIADSEAGLQRANAAGDFLHSSGEGMAHSNVMPCLAFNYIIATTGIYPVSD